MGRKRREPPPPPQEESSSSEEEVEAEATPATQKSPKPPSTTATADDADSSDGSDEESSESRKIDAEAFELRQIAASSGKPAAAAASEVESEDHEPAPPGKGRKRGNAGAEKAAPEPSPFGKSKKAKSGAAEKAPSQVSPSSEGKKKPKTQPEKTAPSGKPEKPGQVRRWSTEDEIKVLKALVRHVKANGGTQPGAGELIAALGDSLQRKKCTYTEMYEKVRNLRVRYEKAVSTGNLPVEGDDLHKFNLSKQVWGKNAKQVAAASMAQNDAGLKKGRTSKEKTDGYSNGATAKEATTSADGNVGTSTQRNKGQATKEKVNEDTKGRSSKNARTVDAPAKSKKQGNHKEELEGHANGGTSVRSKSGKSDKEREDEDAESPRPKETTTATRSRTLLKEGQIHEEKMDTDANTQSNVEGMHKGFDELQNLYPSLTSCVESIQAQHPCGETLKRAFEFINDERARALESKIKKQIVDELRFETRQADTKKEVTNTFIGLLD